MTQTDFLDNNQASAASFSRVLTSGDASSVFGTEYGSVTVVPNSVVTSQVTNPASILSFLMHQNCTSMHCLVASIRQGSIHSSSTLVVSLHRAEKHQLLRLTGTYNVIIYCNTSLL